ncbi:MAG: hypothetical protein ACLVH9_09440 [Fusobacterium sp.]
MFVFKIFIILAVIFLIGCAILDLSAKKEEIGEKIEMGSRFKIQTIYLLF